MLRDPDRPSGTLPCFLSSLQILKPKVDSEHYLKIKKQMIDEHISTSLKERSKWVYVIVTSIISSFAAVIAAASYSGNPALNIAIAISIGFATYRLQDLLKAFSQEKVET
jgi:lipopolysaccharide export LptBFGC system permease protein LptF